MKMTQSLRMSLALTLLCGFAAASCAQTGPSVRLAPTPPMGWNSWNHFFQRVTDADVRAAADAMVANGMQDAGYIYINIDDSWEGVLLVSVGESEIIGEAAVGCELTGTNANVCGLLPCPRLCTQNLDRTRVRNGYRTISAEEFEAWIEAAVLAKLCGSKRDVDLASFPC